MTPTSERLSRARAWLRDLHDRALAWTPEQGTESPTARTSSYIHLLFAFGLARLGLREDAEELHRMGSVGLAGTAEAHTFLDSAFAYRIRQALEGKPHSGPLPANQIEYLETIDRLERYVIDRLRKHSRIIEPDEYVNVYRHWGGRINDFWKSLAELTDLADRTEIANRIDKLLFEAPRGPMGNEQRARVLCAGLEVAPRVDEQFARKMLEQALPAYDALPEPRQPAAVMEQAAFLERALFVAGYYRLIDRFQQVLCRFDALFRLGNEMESGDGWMARFLVVMDGPLWVCIRTLLQFNLCDEVDQFLNSLSQFLLQGRSLDDWLTTDRERGLRRLRCLLPLAGGWYAFGWDRLADPVLEQTRTLLFQNILSGREQTILAGASNQALRLASREVADAHFSLLFERLRGIRDTYTTASHFQVSILEVIESVVLTAVEICART
jgi:hypothetical protein